MTKDISGIISKRSGKPNRKEAGQGRKDTGVCIKSSIMKSSPASSPTFDPTTSGHNMTENPPNIANKHLVQASDKFKLQLFPVNEDARRLLQEGGHNPYLELTLRPRKKISSVLTHLISKWAVSRTTYELVLLSYDAGEVGYLHEKIWALNDKETSAADVYSAIGRPEIFRLKYEFRPNPEKSREKGGDRSRNIVPVEDKPKGNKETGGAAMVSWVDCVTNVSVGQLLTEAMNVSQSKHLTEKSTSSKQMGNCDSFDVAIADLIARGKDSDDTRQPPPALSSIWEAEETRHAFPTAKASSRKDQSSLASDRVDVQDHKSEEPRSDSYLSQAQAAQLALMNFCWDSRGPFGFAGFSKPMSAAEGSSLSGLDPFQNCSLFAMETAPSS